MPGSFIDKNVDKRAKVSLGHNTHGDQLKNRWGQPRVSSNLTFQ